MDLFDILFLYLSCLQAPVTCTPTDGWTTIFTYNNGLSTPAYVKYKKTVGKKYSSTVTQNGDFSSALNGTIALDFFWVFKTELGKKKKKK